MNVIEMARQLGAAIQADERYIRYHKAKEANDDNETLQSDISEFHAIKMMINMEQGKADADQERIKQLNDDLTKLFTKVTENPVMVEFEKARTDMDELLSSINHIITASANGHDPMSVPENAPSSCGAGGCAGCSGCG